LLSVALSIDCSDGSRFQFVQRFWGSDIDMTLGYELVGPARIVLLRTAPPTHRHDKLWVGGWCTTERDALAVLLRYRHLFILLPSIRWRKVEVDTSWSDPLVDDSCSDHHRPSIGKPRSSGRQSALLALSLIATLNTSPTEFVRIVPALSILSSLPNRHSQLIEDLVVWDDLFRLIIVSRANSTLWKQIAG
jgi:hypothetical protein